MERALSYLAQGMSGAETMRMLNRHPNTYSMWRKQSADFRKRSEAIMARNHGSVRVELEAVGDEKPLDTRSLAGFRKHYFGYDTYPHQQQMVDAIENASPGSTTMILMPPEWMKTTTLEDYVCKVLAEEPNKRICDLSEALDHAEKCLGRIQRRMTDRTIAEQYIDDFGPFKSPERAAQKVWNKYAIQLLRSTHDERDYSLACRGGTSRIYGSRYDLIILDDIQSRGSLGSTETLVGLFRQDWRTRVSKTGKIIIIGTRVGRGDFYEELLRLELVDTLVKIPALDLTKPLGQQSNFPAVLDEHGDRAYSASGDPLGWSDEELAKRAHDMGPDIWERVYMQSGRASGAGSFREDIIERCFDDDRDCGGRSRAHRGTGRISGIDPALGGYCALISCSYDAGALYLEGIRNVPGLNRTEEIFQLVEEETIEHLPDYWVWETNSQQKGYAHDDRNFELRDKYGFTILEHHTGTNKLDEKIGVASMASAFSRGEIRLPGTPEGRKIMEPLVSQLLDWRVGVPAKLLRQDMVMALWFVYLRWQNMRATLQQDITAFDRSGAPSFTTYRTTLGTWR
jgi:hypothetical protein